MKISFKTHVPILRNAKLFFFRCTKKSITQQLYQLFWARLLATIILNFQGTSIVVQLSLFYNWIELLPFYLKYQARMWKQSLIQFSVFNLLPVKSRLFRSERNTAAPCNKSFCFLLHLPQLLIKMDASDDEKKRQLSWTSAIRVTDVWTQEVEAWTLPWNSLRALIKSIGVWINAKLADHFGIRYCIQAS